MKSLVVSYRSGDTVHRFVGVLDTSTSGDLLFLSSDRGESLSFLHGGWIPRSGQRYRTLQVTGSSLRIERVLARSEVVVNDVDQSTPTAVQSSPVFGLFARLGCLFRVVRHLPYREGGRPIGDFGSVVLDTAGIESLSYSDGTLTVSVSDLLDHREQAMSYFALREHLASLGITYTVMPSDVGAPYTVPLGVDIAFQSLGIDRPVPQMPASAPDGHFFQTVEQVVAAHPEKNFDWIHQAIRDERFQIVSDATLVSTLEQIKADARSIGFLALDTETTGLDFTFRCFRGAGDRVVGFVLSGKPGTSYYFPIGHTKFPNLCGGDLALLVERYLQPFFDELAGDDVKNVLHNNAFDFKVALASHLWYECWFDTQVFVRKFLNAKQGTPYGLKELTEIYLHRDAPSLNDLCVNGDFSSSGVSFADLPAELVRLYACPDADNTLSLFLLFKESGIVEQEKAWKASVNDSMFSSVVAYAEFYGMHLDLDNLPTLRAEYDRKLVADREALYLFLSAHAPHIDLSSYKVGSPVNLDIAYKHLGYPVQTGKSGNPALDKKAIKFLLSHPAPDIEPFEIADWYKYLSQHANQPLTPSVVSSSPDLLYLLKVEVLRAHPRLGVRSGFDFTDSGSLLITPEKSVSVYQFVGLLKNLRDTERMYSTFFNVIPELFTDDGYCFPKISPFLVTGRVSTSQPNIQGFDDTIKKYITARPGYYCVDTDYSSKENRVIAIMSQEEALLEMFRDWRNDYHRFQAGRMHGVLQELVTPALRQESKGVNFGVNFGMSDASLGAILFGEVSPENTQKAKAKRALFFSFQLSVEEWFEGNVRSAFRKGYTETIFGSKRYYDRAKMSAGSIRRRALNHPIQGSAADIYKAGMNSLFRELHDLGYLGKVLIPAFIHDEAYIEVSNDIHPLLVLGLLRKHLMVDLPGGCPLDIGFGVGVSWYDAKKTEWQVGLQQRLEWRVDAVDWDADIPRFMEKVHTWLDAYAGFDALRVFQDDLSENGVFPIAYALFLNDFLKAYLSHNPDFVASLPDATPLLGSGVSDLWDGELASLPSAPIQVRLFLFWHILNQPVSPFVGVEDIIPRDEIAARVNTFDINAILSFRDASDVGSAASDNSQALLEAQDRAYQLELLKEHLFSFGYRVDADKGTFTLNHTPDAWAFICSLLVPVDTLSAEESYRVVVYAPRKDNFQRVSDWVLPRAVLSQVSAFFAAY